MDFDRRSAANGRKVREMSLVIAAVLIVGGLLAAGLVALAVPALLGLMAYDVVASPKREPVSADAKDEAVEALRSADRARGRIVVERGIARAFVILGGVFWGIAVFAGLYSYGQTGLWWAMLAAFIPFVATLATLVLGWYYERVTALLLVLASAGVVYWGVTHQFEAGVWMLVTVALIGPMVTASVLFWMARREQQALELFLAGRPELVPAMATSRSLS